MKLIAACILAILALASTASAQVQTQEFVYTNRPFSVQSDYVNTGGAPDGFRVYLDGAQVPTVYPATSVTNNVLTVGPFAGLPRGTHTMQLSAFNTGGESRGPVFAFEVRDEAPSAPGGTFRIVMDVNIQAAAGGGQPTVTLRLAQVQQLP